MAQRLPARRSQARVAREDELRILAGWLEQRAVHLDAGGPEAWQAALPGAEQVAFAALPDVLFSDAEAVVGFAQNFAARLGGLAERRTIEQQAGRALAPTPHAAAQLMDLGKPKALGVLDHHHGRLRYIDADLDHGGGD